MNNTTRGNSYKEIAYRVSTVTIIGNFVLTIFKLFAGLVGHSQAMVSDAIHSASDVFSTIVVMIGVAISSKAPDKKHQFGHERLECVAAILLAVVLFLTGAGIGYGAIVTIVSGEYHTIMMPTRIALVGAVVSIVVKEAMYWYTRHAAKAIHSTALMADAWHHRSDALSSIGSLIGIIGARLGILVLDAVASIVICLFIAKAAIDIFLDAVRKLIDECCEEGLQEEMQNVILRQKGVKGIDIFRTRKFADKVYIEVEITVDGNMTVVDSHRIAEQVHNVIEDQFEEVKHCMVHVNPENYRHLKSKDYE